MKEKLVDVLTSIQFAGGARMASNVAELIANHLIAHGVTFPTFKVGDIVWVYDFMWSIIPCEVDMPYHCCTGKVAGCTFEMSFTEEDVGHTVFATKEEAEKYWHENYEREGKNLYLD